MMRDGAVMDSASDSDEYVERFRRTSRSGRRQWCRLRGLDESESENQDRVLPDALRYLLSLFVCSLFIAGHKWVI
jgi:hypothetical protein